MRRRRALAQATAAKGKEMEANKIGVDDDGNKQAKSRLDEALDMKSQPFNPERFCCAQQ